MSTKTLTPSAKPVTVRDSKGRKFLEVVESAYNKALLNDEEAQRVNEAGGLNDLIANYIAEHRLTDKFADEQVSSTWTYHKESKAPRPIEYQVQTLATIFGLDPAQALAYAKNLPQQLPDGAEGWFAILSPSALFWEIKDPAERYCRSVQLAHEKIKASRSFYNYREGQIDVAHLRVHPRTAEMVSQIAEQQKGGILIVAAQLGMSHRGQSTRRAREVFKPNEYGLGSLAGCSIVLVHPERLVRYEELDMDLPGDEFNHPVGDAPFAYAPYLYCRDGKVSFDTEHVGRPDQRYGSGSGFVPQ